MLSISSNASILILVIYQFDNNNTVMISHIRYICTHTLNSQMGGIT